MAPPTDDGFHAACCEGLASLTISDSCLDWFTELFLSGSRGFPSTTPTHCHTGIFADKLVSVIYGAFVYTLITINVLVTLPLVGKRDDFGMIWVRRLPV